MIHLTRNRIQNFAADDAVFQRGLTYFKEKRVIHAACSKNKKQYNFTIQGKQNYRVTVEETGEQDIEFSCNCPAMYVQKGACKHTIAALLYLLQYQEQTERKSGKKEVSGDERIPKIIRYFIDAREPHYEKEVYHAEPIIEIPSMLRNNTDPVYVSLKVGNTKSYRVQMLKRFLTDYKEGVPIILGKEFSYIPQESSFDSSSDKLLRELISYTEVLELLEDKNSTMLFQKSKILITKRLLTRVLQTCKSSTFTLKLGDTELENVRFVNGDPPIEYDIFMQNGSVSMDYKEQERVTPITSDGSLLLRDNVLYLPSARFMKIYLPFYSTLGEKKAPLVFEDDAQKDFLEYVLPIIHETLQVEIPDEVKDRYLELPFHAKIFFDLYNTEIRATVYYQYGEYEFNAFDAPSTGGYILVRDKEKEANLNAIIEDYGFEPHNGFFLLKDEERIYQLLNEGFTVLSEYAELFSSDEFNRIKSARHGLSKMGISMLPGDNLLEIEFKYEDISGEELRSIFYSYRQKKKYHRLEDGSFIDLTDEDFKKTADFLENMNLSYKDFDKEGKLKVTKYHAVYFDSLPQELGIQTEKDANFTNFIDRLLSTDSRKYKVPKAITIPLRTYQKTGFCWLRMLADNGFGGILADDMGLGKTLQAITYMASLVEKNEFEQTPFLVICPTSLLYNWQDEVDNYAPSLRCRLIKGTPEERKAAIEDSTPCDLFITSYPLLRRDLEYYKTREFHTVFIDEAQFIKNALTGNARSVKELHAKARFALTGTPIENSLSELWSIFDFVLPGYLFHYSRFAKRFERPASKGDQEVLQQLNRRVKPFLMRRMKKDVLKELPDKIETKLVTELTEEQRLLYLSYAKEARNEINNEIERVGLEKSRMQILAALTRLRQICSHPGMFLDNYDGGSGKLSLFLQILDELRKNEHRVLVFSQFTSMLEILQEALTEAEIPYYYLHGGTKPEQRLEDVKAFNAGERDVFLISLKAGGTGLNLTGADTVIHFDPWWNPAVEDQASDRAHRIGQTKNVHVIRMLTKGTIEEKIFRLQQKKQDLFHAVIESGETFLNKLTKEDIAELFADLED